MITSPKKGAAIAGLRACITFSPLISRRAAQALAVGALLASGLHPAQAQTAYTDSGATLLFSTGITPTITAGTSAANGDTLLFNGANYTQTDDIATALNFNALTFANTGAVILNQGAGTTITLASTTGGTAPTITLNNAGALTLNLNLSFANNTTITQTHAATFGGVISGAAATINLNNTVGASSTANALTLTGTNTFGGQWIVASTGGSGTSFNYGNVDLILSSATGPSIAGNLQIGTTGGNPTGVLATVANQFAPTSVISFNGGLTTTPNNFVLHANQTIAGLNSINGNNAVEIDLNGDATNYGPVTLTLGSATNYSYGGNIRNIDTAGATTSILSLTKTGAGQQTLTGSTTYTGGTTVSAGTLTFKDSHSGSSNFVDNGTLEFNVTGTNTQDLSSGTISGTGTLLKSGTGTLQIGAQGQPQNVSMTAGTIDVEGGLLRNEYGNGVWTNNKASLNVASGATVNLWDSGITVDALTGSGTVTHTDHGGSQNFTVGVNNGSGIFSGTITDVSDGATPGAHPIALVKKGTGTQTLTGTDSYTGGTTISGGTLAGTTTSLQGNITDNSALVFDQTLPTASIASGTYAGVISGTGTVTKNNAGTVSFTGANTYSGATTINGGTLQIGNGTTNSNLSASTSLTLANNTTLSFDQSQGSTVSYSAFPIMANGNATLIIAGGNTTTSNIASPITIGTSGTPTLTINETEAQATVNLTGVISGTGNLAITSSGSANGNPFAVTINKAETYSGSTTLTQTGLYDYPQLQLLAGGSLPATTILNLSSSSNQARNVSLDLNGQAQTLAGLVSGGATPSHDVVFNSSTTASTLTVNPTGNDFFGGVIGGTGPNNNNLGLTVGGTGTLQLSGQNTYTGPTNVTNGGALDLFSTTQTAIAGTSNVNISTGGTVVIDNHGGGMQQPYANQFTLNGNGGGTYAGKGALETFNSGNFSFSGPIILQTDSSIGLNPDAQGAVTVSGVISGAGSLTLIGESAIDTGYPANTTAPTVLLTNTNTYAGVNTLLTSNNNGTTAGNVFGVTLGGGSGQTNILPSTTQLIFGGTPAGAAGTYNQNVTVTLNNDNQSVAGVSSTGTGAYTIIGGNAAQSTLTVTPTGTSTFNGVIGGTGLNNNNLALTKSGAGTQVLTGTNTYTGATTITAGTLQVGSGGATPTGSIASSSIAVGGGATLITASNGALNSSATAVNLGDGNGNATVQNGAFTGATAANNIQKAGALSLGLGTADILDFAGKFGTFDFASAAGSGFSLVGTSLNVRNFGTATNESTLGGNYQLLFDTALTTAQLGDISFLNSDSSQFGAIQQFVSGTSGQVQILEGTASAPEPAQTAALGLFGLGLGALVLKARKRSSVAAG